MRRVCGLKVDFIEWEAELMEGGGVNGGGGVYGGVELTNGGGV